VQVGVEHGSGHGLDLLDAMAAKGGFQFLGGHFNAAEQVVAGIRQVGPVIVRQGGEGTGEIIRNAQQVAGKALDRIDAGLGHLTLGALAGIVEISQRAQQLLAQLFGFDLQAHGFLFRRDFRVSLRFHGFSRLRPRILQQVVSRRLQVCPGGFWVDIGVLAGLGLVAHHFPSFARRAARISPITFAV